MIRSVELASFVLGIVGTVTGVGALAWELVKWNREGPDVAVSVNQALPISGGQVGELVTCVIASNTTRYCAPS